MNKTAAFVLFLAAICVSGCHPSVMGSFSSGNNDLMFKGTDFQFITSGFAYRGTFEQPNETTITLHPTEKLGQIAPGEKPIDITITTSDKWKTIDMKIPLELKFEKENDWVGGWIEDKRWEKEGSKFAVVKS